MLEGFLGPGHFGDHFRGCTARNPSNDFGAPPQLFWRRSQNDVDAFPARIWPERPSSGQADCRRICSPSPFTPIPRRPASEAWGGQLLDLIQNTETLQAILKSPERQKGSLHTSQCEMATKSSQRTSGTERLCEVPSPDGNPSI